MSESHGQVRESCTAVTHNNTPPSIQLLYRRTVGGESGGEPGARPALLGNRSQGVRLLTVGLSRRRTAFAGGFLVAGRPEPGNVIAG